MLLARNVTRAWLGSVLLAIPLFSATLLSVQASPQEDVLTLVPQDAWGFAVINRLSDVSEKLEKLSRDLELPLPDLLTMLKAKLGGAEGLDEKGHLLLVLLPPREGQPQPRPLLVLPVTDYGKLLETLHGDASADISEIEIAGKTALVGSQGAHAIMVAPDSRAVLERMLHAKTACPAEVDSIATWIGENDGTVVLLNSGLKQVARMASEGLEKAKEKFSELDLGKGKGEQVVAAMEMYIQMLRIIRDEIHTVGKGLRIDADGNFLFGARVRFNEGGILANLASATKTEKTDLLANLPGGPFVGALSATWSPEYSEGFAQWSVLMMRYQPFLRGMKLGEEEARQYAKASALSMEGVRRMAMFMASGEENEKLLENFTGMIDVVDADQYLANYEIALRGWQKLMEGSKSPISMKMEVEQVTVNGLQGLKISMDMKRLMDTQGAPPESTRMMEQMFGTGWTMTLHVLASDAHTILLSYAPAESIEKKIAAHQKNKTRLADEPGVSKIASLLPESPNMIAYLNPRGVVAWFQRLMGTVLPPGVQAPAIPDFPITPPIGFTSQIVNGGLESECVVPAELPKAIKDFIQRVKRPE